MTRSPRVLLAVMATMTLAACSIDPVSPAPSVRPSLNLTSTPITVSATTVSATTVSPTTVSPTTVSTSTCSTQPVISATSTYIVAYSELPTCPPPPSDSVTVVAAPKLDSLSLKLSFP